MNNIKIDDDDVLDLGTCCVCAKGRADGVTIKNIILLPHRSPSPGKGWGCVECGLPMDGALAVVCDGCLGQELRFACFGYPSENGRVLMAELPAEPFDHDMSKHPEENHGLD